MKYILIVLLSLACNKEDEPKAKCYKCEVSGWFGQPGYNQDICTDRIDTVKFTTPTGQSLGSTCIEK